MIAANTPEIEVTDRVGVLATDRPTAEEMVQRRDTIRRHNLAYYRDDAPTISDEEYDALYSELVEIEARYPELITSDSPTQVLQVLAVDGLEKVRHQSPLMSIGNTYSVEGVAKFDEAMTALNGGPPEYAVELKYDGLAISLQYQKGVMVMAATRGDHEVGEDVTENVRQIAGIPQQIEYQGDLDVRGEILMPTASFLALNAEREVTGEKLFASARNAASGSLRLLDPAETGRRNLILRAYSISHPTLPEKVTTQVECLQWLKDQGFPCDTPQVCTRLTGIQAVFEQISAERHLLEFDVDGVVYKVNDLALQFQAGFTSRTPKALIAYKFNQQETTTVLQGIRVQVGRSGTLTPVAILQPVSLGGVTVSRATLHNEAEIARKDIRIGDTVKIRRNGDVIPGVIEVILAFRPTTAVPFQMPDKCPSCGAPVSRVPDEVAVRCSAGKGCSEQKYQRLAYFVSRPAMNMDGLGEKAVRQLVEAGLVSTPDQFYDLLPADFLKLPGFAEKSAEDAFAAIQASRKQPFHKVLVALGIPGVGTSTAKKLAKTFVSLSRLMRGTLVEFTAVPDVGESVGTEAMQYFADEQNVEMLRRLSSVLNDPAFKVNPEVTDGASSGTEMAPPSLASKLFTDKTFVITGTLPGYSREAAQDLIEQHGGKVSGSVSRKTSYVLYGDAAGTKLDKAREQGIQLLTIADLLSLVGDRSC